MTSLSDTLTVGLVLVLLFGSIALYLYTCIQQSEQKISLLESILLDLKMSAEVKSYTDLPADEHIAHVTSGSSMTPTAKQGDAYVPFEDEPEEGNDHVVEIDEELPSMEVAASPKKDEENYSAIVADAIENSPPNYDGMSLKELQGLALTRGITGAKAMKKGPLLEALRTSDRVRPGSNVVAGSSSFVESSASVSDESA